MLTMQRQLYFDWMEQQKKIMTANIAAPPSTATTTIASQMQNLGRVSSNLLEGPPPRQQQGNSSISASSQRELKNLAQTLKQELASTLSSSIDRAFNDFAQAEAAR